MNECVKCHVVLLDELMDGEKIGRPHDLFCLDCYTEAESDDPQDLEPSVLNPAKETISKRVANI